MNVFELYYVSIKQHACSTCMPVSAGFYQLHCMMPLSAGADLTVFERPKGTGHRHRNWFGALLARLDSTSHKMQLSLLGCTAKKQPECSLYELLEVVRTLRC